MKPIRFSDEAKADIRAIPQHIAMNILTAIHRLAEHGSGNVKKLQGSDPPEGRFRGSVDPAVVGERKGACRSSNTGIRYRTVLPLGR